MNKILQKGYLKNLVTLTTGTLIAQVIAIMLSPIITRIYSPEDMGVYTIVLTVISIFVPIINLRYEMLIVSANDEDEAGKIAIASIIIGVLITIIILLGIVILNLCNFSSFRGVGLLIYLSVPILFIQVFINVFNNFNNRLKQYKLLASVSIIRSITQVTLQILLGLFKLGALGLLFSQFISLLTGLGKQKKGTPGFTMLFQNVKKKEIIKTLRKYKNQPLFSAPAVFINALSYSLITLMISGLFDLKEVGYYSLSFRILGLPISLISANVAQVFFSHASEEKRSNGDFRSTFNKTALLLTIISIPVFSFLMIFSEKIFGIVFGQEWSRAGFFVTILSPMFAIKFISSSLSLSVIVAKKQKRELLLQLIFLLQTIISYLVVEIYNLNIEWFLGLVSLLYTVTYLYWLLIMWKFSRDKNE